LESLAVLIEFWPSGPQSIKIFVLLANPETGSMLFPPNNTCTVFHRMHMELQLLMAQKQKRWNKPHEKQRKGMPSWR